MATKTRLKRWNGSAYEEVDPKTSWGQITDKPTEFIAEDHTHMGEDIIDGDFSNISSITLSGDKKLATESYVDDAVIAGTNNYVTGISGDGNSTLTLTREGLEPISEDLSHDHTLADITDSGSVASINTNNSNTQFLRGDGNWVQPNYPTVPVDSVNNKTGAVTLDYSDVGAASAGHNHDGTYADLDSHNKVPLNQLPDESKSQTYVTTSSATRPSSPLEGDKLFETDTGNSYIYDGSNWVVMADADWENVSLEWTNISSKPATATRWPAWGEVTSKPSTFTPSSHTHSSSEVTGLAAVATSGSYTDLNDTPSLSITNWNTAYNKRVTGLSGTGNSTLAIALADNTTVTQDLAHNHSISQVTNLSTELDDKVDSSSLAKVATSGSYSDLSGTPSLSITNWNTAYDKRVTGLSGTGNSTLAIALADNTTVTQDLVHNHSASQVTGLAAVATSGSYTDLSNTPSLNTSDWDSAYDNLVNNAFTDSDKGNGTLTIARRDTTNLIVELDHTHSISDVSGLQTELNTIPDASDFVQKSGDTMTGGLNFSASGNRITLTESNTNAPIALRGGSDAYGGWIGYSAGYGISMNAGSNGSRHVGIKGGNAGFYTTTSGHDFEVRGDGAVRFHNELENSDGDPVFELVSGTLYINDNR